MTEEKLQQEFRANPARCIENLIKDFVATSPANRLPAFENAPMYEEPLVGFADGDDAIYIDYKKIIGEFHLTPREIMELHYKEKDGIWEQPARVSVISWILPVDRETRISQRSETQVPSLRWNHTRWQGDNLMNALIGYLVDFLEAMGHYAVAPDKTGLYELEKLPSGISSTWSQRHIAYVAGLGTFGLSDGFITEKGISVRLGSLVCDAGYARQKYPVSK